MGDRPRTVATSSGTAIVGAVRRGRLKFVAAMAVVVVVAGVWAAGAGVLGQPGSAVGWIAFGQPPQQLARSAGQTSWAGRDATLRPYLGITYMPIGGWPGDGGSDANWGVVVTAVKHASPAECAGIRAGDIIYLFDEQPLAHGVSLLDLLWSKQPFDTVSLVGWRDHQDLNVRVKLGAR